MQDFDKYKYYLASVQSPETDAEFIQTTYEQLKGKKPQTMREDFCGTFSLTSEWVKLSADHQGIAIDLDQEPLDYGKQHFFETLTPEQQQRLKVIQQNVLSPELPKADIINALNFSYFIFKQRHQLKEYFQAVYDGLNEDGLFVMDCFGGSECAEANENETEYDDFSYFWDQNSFDPISNHAQFYIHFKLPGEPKRERVFSYDWRLWSIPEIRELLTEVGFKRSHIYWEGTDEDGDGDGEFFKTEVGEECESWVCYIVGEK